MAKKTEEQIKRESLIKEATDIILKRANTTKKEVMDMAVRKFVANNVDLLTPAEVRKYKSILL